MKNKLRKTTSLFLTVTLLTLLALQGCNTTHDDVPKETSDTITLRIELVPTDDQVRKKAILLIHQTDGTVLARYDLDLTKEENVLVVEEKPNAYITVLQQVWRKASLPSDEGGIFAYANFYQATTYPLDIFTAKGTKYIELNKWGNIEVKPGTHFPYHYNAIHIEGTCPEAATELSTGYDWWPPQRIWPAKVVCDEGGQIKAKTLYIPKQEDGKSSLILWAYTRSDRGYSTPLEPYQYVALWDQESGHDVTIRAADFKNEVNHSRLIITEVPKEHEIAFFIYHISAFRNGAPTLGFTLNSIPCHTTAMDELCSEAILANEAGKFDKFKTYGKLSFESEDEQTQRYALSWSEQNTIGTKDTWNFQSRFLKPFDFIFYDEKRHVVMTSSKSDPVTSHFAIFSYRTKEPYAVRIWNVFAHSLPTTFNFPELTEDLIEFYPNFSETHAAVYAEAFDFEYFHSSPPPSNGRMIYIYKRADTPLIKNAPSPRGGALTW